MGDYNTQTLARSRGRKVAVDPEGSSHFSVVDEQRGFGPTDIVNRGRGFGEGEGPYLLPWLWLEESFRWAARALFVRGRGPSQGLPCQRPSRSTSRSPAQVNLPLRNTTSMSLIKQANDVRVS